VRTLARNKQTLYYALYKGEKEVVDGNGYKTGETVVEYGEPVKARMSITDTGGSSDLEMFGVTDYSVKTLITDDMKCPIDKDSILWIGIPTTEPHNYVLTKPPLKSLNQIKIIVKEVKTS
jgi:hypothetical protein